MKRLDSIDLNGYLLEVIECDCGFHIGLDASYLDQVGEICIICPSCKAVINTAVVCPEEENDPAFKIVQNEDQEGFNIQGKRMAIPFAFNTECPKCGCGVSQNFHEQNFTYPRLEKNESSLYCYMCGHEWTIEVNSDIQLAPNHKKNDIKDTEQLDYN